MSNVPTPDIWVQLRKAAEHPDLRERFPDVTTGSLHHEACERYANGAHDAGAIGKDPARNALLIHIGRYARWKDDGPMSGVA